ncbi:MAG: homocysteine S-methyltransferase family protein, partial [Firmicutes bacterium]|nr:homocysteine S-methyltransferase family protein [Bacillota bacterium]
MKLLNALKNRILFFDGGTGTLLMERGLLPGEPPEGWNLSRAEDITDIHRAYLRAGADIICANTFGASEIKL